MNTHRMNQTTVARFTRGQERRQDETGTERTAITAPTGDSIGEWLQRQNTARKGLGIVRILANRMSGRY